MKTPLMDNYLRLAVNLATSEPYVTLSHCWGNSQPLTLTSANLNKLQTRIAYDSLPRTFQDAVTVTRALGVRYLWIDSLCIIQDSTKDWEVQCTKMAQIYSGSIVTIAGVAAPNPDSGFMYPRKPLCQMVLQTTDGEESGVITVSHFGYQRVNNYCPTTELNSPLLQRGWVLQERLLSGRILYFGSKNMYFECSEAYNFDNCHCSISRTYLGDDTAAKRLIGQFKSAYQIFEYWVEIVETYGKTFLTHATDKLPALSAIASEFHRVTGYRYLAGLWQEDLPRALTWFIPYYIWEQSLPMPV